jgi:hypothetical protein
VAGAVGMAKTMPVANASIVMVVRSMPITAAS